MYKTVNYFTSSPPTHTHKVCYLCHKKSKPNFKNTVFFDVMACSQVEIYSRFFKNFSKFIRDYMMSRENVIATAVRPSNLTTTYLTGQTAMRFKTNKQTNKNTHTHTLYNGVKESSPMAQNPSKSTVSHSVHSYIYPSSQPASLFTKMPVVISVPCHSITSSQADSPRWLYWTVLPWKLKNKYFLSSSPPLLGLLSVTSVKSLPHYKYTNVFLYLTCTPWIMKLSHQKTETLTTWMCSQSNTNECFMWLCQQLWKLLFIWRQETVY